jgi:hypothetical protein
MLGVPDKLVHPRTGVAAHRRRRARLVGQLRRRRIQHRDLVGCVSVALPGRSIATNGSPVPPWP